MYYHAGGKVWIFTVKYTEEAVAGGAGNARCLSEDGTVPLGADRVWNCLIADSEWQERPVRLRACGSAAEAKEAERARGRLARTQASTVRVLRCADARDPPARALCVSLSLAPATVHPCMHAIAEAGCVSVFAGAAARFRGGELS